MIYEERKSFRQSNIELLKIIAIFIIAISHFVPYYGDNTLPSYVNLSEATKKHTKCSVDYISLFRAARKLYFCNLFCMVFT